MLEQVPHEYISFSNKLNVRPPPQQHLFRTVAASMTAKERKMQRSHCSPQYAYKVGDARVVRRIFGWESPAAHSDSIRPLNPMASGHPFRFDPATDSGASGHPI
ncbi:hypothetical protein [Leisingera sp. M523]|uniref:hypothetical protein n=1 Tax=Leisingera sp. M523 TaxID=2867013 RepID=UPI0021A48B14|nr:hypothetical protein [Leisingera sp. M523]UWQ27787.1 hypothetical protein K3557_13420 [Leisingera sp. M523]